jgi:hypothetical protein
MGQGCNDAGEGSALKPLAKILRRSVFQHATLERGNESSESTVCLHVILSIHDILNINKQQIRVSERRIVGRVPNASYARKQPRSRGQNKQKTTDM